MDKALVLGGGSAGLLAALALKRRMPEAQVEVIASKRIGVIGVGEGTVPYVVDFIHRYLGFDEAEFFRQVDPVYKLGVRFAWGKAAYYDYSFDGNQHLGRYSGLSRNIGFFEEGGCIGTTVASALMEAGRALPSTREGLPDLPLPGNQVAWHLENHRFVDWLENACDERGVLRREGEVDGVIRREDEGVDSLLLKSGEKLKADLFVDASGFLSRLLGDALEEPRYDFSNALFCNRALVGGWEREPGEPILAYTLSDTMKAGWAWRIDHPERINRGYVFNSELINDEEAGQEFREANPKLKDLRVVKFKPGRYRRAWVGNVAALGNAYGFVEPLEATAIMCICLQSRWLADSFAESLGKPPETMRSVYNRQVAGLWDGIRDFLALHYRFNDRLDTPFWQQCRNETALGNLNDFVEFYRECGPTSLAGVLIDSHSPFGLEGHLAHMIGMGVRHQNPFRGSASEQKQFELLRQKFNQVAQRGLRMDEVREFLREVDNWNRLPRR